MECRDEPTVIPVERIEEVLPGPSITYLTPVLHPAGNRVRNFRDGIMIPVVLSAVAYKHTTICLHCGEPKFSRNTTEQVRRMVHGETTAIKSIQMGVFAYR